LAEEWEAHSAGMEASSVHPKAIEVMREIWIDISNQHSKSFKELSHLGFDLVITLCSDAEQRCPFYLGKGKRAHIGFDDPAETNGTDEDILNTFRRVRDEIKKSILNLLQDYN
jgi:arsenate reductase